MHWSAWHEKYGDTCFGWYPDHNDDSQLTFQHQRGWCVNIDVSWRGRFIHRLTIVTCMANERHMQHYRSVGRIHRGEPPLKPRRISIS